MAPARLFTRFLYLATAINVLGLPIAVVRGEPLHATVHAVLALACGFWALRLRHPRGIEEAQRLAAAESPGELESGGQSALQDEWLRRQAEQEKQRRPPQ